MPAALLALADTGMRRGYVRGMPMPEAERQAKQDEIDARLAAWSAAATAFTTRVLVLKIQGNWQEIAQARAAYMATARAEDAAIQALCAALAADDLEIAAAAAHA
jgi:hypothetical protein